MNEKGQALLEAVIVIPVLLLLVFGITEFGRALYTWNSLNNASRAGARAAVVTSGLTPAGATSLNNSCSYGDTGDDRVYAAVCSNLSVGFKNKSDVDVTIDIEGAAATPGRAVTVTVVMNNFQSVVPKLIQITPTLTARTVMRYE